MSTGKQVETIADLTASTTTSVSYRRGIAENIDAGALVGGPGMVAVDARYQITSGNRFASAVGAGLAYHEQPFQSGPHQATVDLQLPVYSSYELTDAIVVYYSRKYIVRLVRGSSTDTRHLLGGSGGIRIGRDWGFDLEADYAFDLEDHAGTMQLGGSLFF
ncbi:hypothetical protein ACFL6C_00360 [Myxococcota bacterium]